MTQTATAPGPAGVPQFDNSYARELDGAYVAWAPSAPPHPRAVRLNHALAAELGLPDGWIETPEALAMLSGSTVPDGAQPIAQAYSGHQFGSFSPLLGDGRAVLLGELDDVHGVRRDLAFKGSGRTPFSRGGDGKAALGPVLREYLMGEAMHALGIPTTRVLAAVATGETVQRERVLPGAVLTRVAASHLRVGTFEFAARRDHGLLRRLAEYAIARHYPELAAIEPDAERYLALLRGVIDRQTALIARWMGVGFIHGVMNTDNMTVSGETIDFGPCAFVEAYDPRAAFSSIDHGGRYAFGNQPAIAGWNLTRFAETLGPLIGDDRDVVVPQLLAALDDVDVRYAHHWTAVLRRKLGIDATSEGAGDANVVADRALGEDYLELLRRHEVDFTLGWRGLVDLATTDDAQRLRDRFGPDGAADLDQWLERWRERLQRNGSTDEGREVDLDAMRRANPIYIPRNHRVEAALTAAVEHDDLAPFERLLAVLADPFAERSDDAEFAEPAPTDVTATYRTFCGT
ncbi:MAG: YdiU family protein [Kineosporiaceae bacterium]|nr:YdiU family protein [Kineosporiaceae bacterium]